MQEVKSYYVANSVHVMIKFAGVQFQGTNTYWTKGCDFSLGSFLQGIFVDFWNVGACDEALAPAVTVHIVGVNDRTQ